MADAPWGVELRKSSRGLSRALPVSVVVAARNTSMGLVRCLSLVREQARELSGEVVVVLNTSPLAVPPCERAQVEGLCDWLGFEQAPGKSNALNRAIKICRGSVVAFTDDDTEPQAGWLKSLIAPLQDRDRDPALVGVGGRVVPTLPPSAPAWYRQMIEAKRVCILGPRHEPEPEPFVYRCSARVIYTPIGANCAYRREVFDDHRYDPELGPNEKAGLRGGEDTEFGRRLMRDAFKLCYTPEAVVLHPVCVERLDLPTCRRRFFAHGVEKVRVAAKLRIPVKSRQRICWERRLLLVLYVLVPFVQSWSSARIGLKREQLRGMLAELDHPGLAPAVVLAQHAEG